MGYNQEAFDAEWVGSANNAPPTISRQPQAGNLSEEVDGGASVGRGSNFQDEVPYAKEPEARWRGGWQHQKARLEVLPAEDGTPAPDNTCTAASRLAYPHRVGIYGSIEMKIVN